MTLKDTSGGACFAAAEAGRPMTVSPFIAGLTKAVAVGTLMAGGVGGVYFVSRTNENGGDRQVVAGDADTTERRHEYPNAVGAHTDHWLDRFRLHGRGRGTALPGMHRHGSAYRGQVGVASGLPNSRCPNPWA